MQQGTPVRTNFGRGVPERSSRERKTVSLVNGQNAQPLIPQSETTFETETAEIAFMIDSSGQVTHLVLSAAGGDNRYDRKR